MKVAKIPKTRGFKDITGKTFGRLKVLGYVGGASWMCKCSCGAEKTVGGGTLRAGTTQSCGCFRRDLCSEAFKTHGDTISHTTKEYRSYRSMLARCNNPRTKKYRIYGARGIKVCARWMQGYETFLADMGRCPEGFSIDRIDNDGDYEPRNCRWASAKTQSRNRSTNIWLDYRGERLCLKDMAEKWGLKDPTVRARLNRGWSVEDALTTPVR